MSTQTQAVTVKSLLRREDYQGRFKEILGARAAQFTASIVNVTRDKYISECEPNSVIAAGIVAATLDLPVDRNLGFAWIVPYKEKGVPVAQFQMGYKGFIQLALRSGQYKRMNARIINKEAFAGFDEIGEPIIKWDLIDETKPAVGYAFAWQLTSGFSKTCYWPKTRVEAHARQYSQSYRGNFQSPWKTHFDGMAIKTVIKNELSDWGILSVELQKAMRHDQGAQADIDSEVVYTDNATDVESVPPAEIKGPGAPQLPATPPTAPEAPKAPESPKPAESQQPPPPAPEAAKCKYCNAEVVNMAEHNCPEMQEALKQTGGAGTETASADEGKELLASIRTIMGQNEINDAQLTAWTEKNKITKAGQKWSDCSTAKLKSLNSALQKPATIADVKKPA